MLGSSLGFSVQPGGSGWPWPRQLELLLNERAPDDEVWLVDNLCEVASTTDDLERMLARVLQLQPDVVVLQYGRGEALLRPCSRRTWRRNGWQPVTRSPLEARLRRRLLRTVIRTRRALGLVRPWVPLRRFEQTFDRALTFMQQELASAIVVLGSTPVSDLQERRAPGSRASVARHETAMRTVVDRHGVAWVPFEDVLAVDPEVADGDVLAPDGLHFSIEAHTALAQVVVEHVARIAPRT